MPHITSSKTQPSYDVIVVGSGAGGGQTAYTLTMEGAKVLWEKLGLPKLTPEMPWYGYSLGDWTEEWDRNALQATRGEWMQRSESYRQRRRSDIPPNTPVRSVEGKDD